MQIKRNSEGFSLIEILVVLAIVLLISVFAIPNISSYFQISLNSAAREFATTIKETYNSAVITGNVYRIVYDFKANNYWVESGPPTALVDTKESKEKEERRKKFSRLSSETAEKSSFSMDTVILKKKKSLPTGAVFEDLVTQQSPDPITEGVAFTHFFPNGLTEQTIIHLKDQANHHVSLIITPLLGTTELYDRYLDAKEAFDKNSKY